MFLILFYQVRLKIVNVCVTRITLLAYAIRHNKTIVLSTLYKYLPTRILQRGEYHVRSAAGGSAWMDASERETMIL